MKYIFLIIVIILAITTFPIRAQETTSLFEEKTEYIDSLAQIIGDIELSLTKIDDNNYLITGMGVAGNVGVYIAGDGVYLIDNQWSALADKIKEMVGSVTSKPIKSIINTHFHFDHTQGNMAFGKEGIPIIAQTNARTRMMQRQVIHGHVSQVQNPYPPEGLPTLTFSNNVEFYDEDETLELKYLGNAHTDGDIVVYLKNADIYYLGDLFVTYGLPVIDPDAGGDIYAFIETLDYLISNSNDQTKFVPGHGPVSYKKDLVIFRDLLYSVKEYIKDSYKKGKDLNHTITDAKETVLKDVGGVDADRFVTLVYGMVIRHEN
jgi:glyoxylase-like metal-dependent hydrolase (beta-lactamase superfamily II)